MESAHHVLVESAKHARHGSSCYVRDAGHAERLRQAAQGIKNKPLQAAIAAGIGFHHAGLDEEERALVEQLFLQLDILVSCCTLMQLQVAHQ
jgi:replicative superfamily II helicase